MRNFVVLFVGSSPLTRGARVVTTGNDRFPGLIPAHAGSTRSASRISSPCRAHPRSRGEHFAPLGSTHTTSGSSPLTRGALGVRIARRCWCGLIPAHAGSTFVVCRWMRHRRAHPRSRGEHGCSGARVVVDWGSSPLTRGALHGELVHHAGGRLIPAHAGSTCVVDGVGRPGWAHPRSRGEHVEMVWDGAKAVGSSPLTRGALRPLRSTACRPGLIPAHAGSTSGLCPRSQSCGAHPRSRGEHFNRFPHGLIGMGSSPLTRGARLRHLEKRDELRLIPAHAGSTQSSTPAQPWKRAHPRSRGEHSALPSYRAR